jgi:DNA polymerase-3 subunit epsilon
MLDQPLTFLDLETTGATASHDRVTEIGLVEVDGGRHIGEWSTLVNPGMRIPGGIQALTGITDEMVAAAPEFGDISRDLRHRLEGRLIVAHNARFDYGFLRSEFQRAGVRYRSDVLCTVKLSRRLFPQHARHNLDALMARHGIDCEARHRALGDARVLWRLVQCWRRDLAPNVISDAIVGLVLSPAVPPQLPVDAFDDLPEAPGVYVFYAENAVLYVGKSANLRTGVLSHFSGDRRGPRDVQIVREVVRIDWTETPGALGALIEASRLMKALKPIHNRRARCSEEIVLQPWPFRGRVGIRETAAQFEHSELIVLDRWCYLGTARAEHELPEIEERKPVFDADTYRILTRFLRKPRRASPIVDLATR